KIATGCLFTFREKQGQPQLYKCTFFRGEENITLKFGNAVYYKTSKCVPATSAQAIVSTLQSQWVSEHSCKDTGYEKLDLPRGFRGRIPIVIALSLASEVSKTKKKRGEFALFPPDLGFA